MDIGLEYDRLRNDGWTETISGNPTLIANSFDGERDESLAVPLGLRFNKLFRFRDAPPGFRVSDFPNDVTTRGD